MSRSETLRETLKQLLGLHAMDQEIIERERELDGLQEELATIDDAAAAMRTDLEKAEAELRRLRIEARSGERAVEEKREGLDRLRSRMNAVKNQRQYSAATLEYDLVRRDLRALEDQVLDKLQVIEELETRGKELATVLEETRATGGSRREQLEKEQKQLLDDLAIKRDRRGNLAIRLESRVVGLYDRIRGGRSRIALAPLTEEGVCGHCFTAVPTQLQAQIKGLSDLVCCEGCGVILYLEGLES